MTARFRIESLASAHDRKSFASGVEPLDRYFRELVTQDIKRRVSNCFVALDDEGLVAGYYTFAATSLPLTELSAEETRRLPRYALMPAGLIRRLAIDRRFQGLDLGGALIMDAAARAARSDPAIFALIVDAKDERAAAFYEHLQFQRFVSRPMTLFLPLATLLAALTSQTGKGEG
ncbi:MAG: GNAT family N-acetyltransferase [Caulobacteraceae bacterium]